MILFNEFWSNLHNNCIGHVYGLGPFFLSREEFSISGRILGSQTHSQFIWNVAAASRLMRKDDNIEVVFVINKLKIKTVATALISFRNVERSNEYASRLSKLPK
jgi:hypothetical protein